RSAGAADGWESRTVGWAWRADGAPAASSPSSFATPTATTSRSTGASIRSVPPATSAPPASGSRRGRSRTRWRIPWPASGCRRSVSTRRKDRRHRAFREYCRLPRRNAILPCMWWSRRRRKDEIDGRLRAELGHGLHAFHVHIKELPQYRFVDVFRAAEHQARALGVTATIESDHRDEYLASILHARPARWISRRIRLAERVAWPTGPDDEVFLPVDVIWVCAGARTGPMIVRAHWDVRREKAS